MAKIFLISPIEGVLEGSRIHTLCRRYVQEQNRQGNSVFWPWRDLRHNDSFNLPALGEIFRRMRDSERIAICWSSSSGGSILGLGIWFSLRQMFRKPLDIVNPQDLEKTENKSLVNLLLAIHEKNLIQEARNCRLAAQCARGLIGAVIIKDGRIISKGANRCQAFSTKEGCRRAKLPPKVQQELCGTLHAELAAVLNIRPDRPAEDYQLCFSPSRATAKLVRQLWTSQELEKLRGARIIFSGHSYSCDNCRQWLRFLGIREIVRDELYAYSGLRV